MAGKERQIAVEIENRTLVPIMGLSTGATERTVPLTTLADNQRRALVNVYLVHGADGDRTFLKQFDLDNLPPRPARQQRFFFTCAYDGRYRLQCRLSVDGEVRASDSVDLKPHFRGRKRATAVGGILLVLLVAALLAALMLRGCRETTPAVQIPNTATPAPATEPPAAPAPSAEPPAAQPPATPPTPPAATHPPDQRAAPGTDPVESEVVTLQPVTRELVIYFFPDDPRLTEQSREQLRTLAGEISGWESVSIEVEGHCAPLGSEAGRVALSRGRAENSAAFLERTGLPAGTALSVSWHAGERPVTDDPDRQDLNRRVELSVRGRSALQSR
jgi:outer membrane protein OmpA-like peptidoglycan-associated protein